jgi:hypothetical protein
VLLLLLVVGNSNSSRQQQLRCQPHWRWMLLPWDKWNVLLVLQLLQTGSPRRQAVVRLAATTVGLCCCQCLWHLPCLEMPAKPWLR